ncbi:hypothetical protein M501DRAFT_1054507 [Patellaria atrata CBS 101060]|uniref:Methyltransferase n=1 Tax=Patellaria atrata CBS 101060 TaxID=1346257 RepID=A0A9P4VSA3_9PEZI|nr:hypothetical protein M501DRAFT_1054507 [Patellaria atrata CBS 101060]
MEKFDLVHICTLSGGIRDADPTPVLKTALKMLKPGEWLRFVVDHRNRIGSFEKRGARDQAHLGCDLEKWFEHAGFERVLFERLSWLKQVRKPLTDDLLMALEEMAFNTKRCVKDATGLWGTAWGHSLEEVADGVTMIMDPVICYGRKPFNE